MSGYTPDEKLRLQQLRELRRQWLKDQELSPREPLLPPQRLWPMEKFWNKFLRGQAPWRNVIYKVYRHSIFAFTCVVIPAWIIHYYLKYHVNIQSSLEKWLILGLVQGKDKMSLQCQRVKMCSKNDGGISKGHGVNLNGFPLGQ